MSWGYKPYERVGDKKARAQKKIASMRKQKKYADIEPVTIEGRSIAKNWWGKAWCTNLESYADYSNRIGRGSAYVKNGMVIDLEISEGTIRSLVMGSGSTPYECSISINTLPKKKWADIKKLTVSSFDSVQSLLDGKFPKELQNSLSDKGSGLFPAPREIKFDCDCPDWADMCKHIAATLYAVGARLDHKPELLFSLRGVDMNELISDTIADHKSSLIGKALKVKSKRIMKIKDNPLGSLFDIDFKS